MGTQAPSVYQQVIEKTKGIMSRTQELARNIEKKLNVDKMGYDGVRTTHKKYLYFLFDCACITSFVCLGLLFHHRLNARQHSNDCPVLFFVQFSLLFCATWRFLCEQGKLHCSHSVLNVLCLQYKQLLIQFTPSIQSLDNVFDITTCLLNLLLIFVSLGSMGCIRSFWILQALNNWTLTLFSAKFTCTSHANCNLLIQCITKHYLLISIRHKKLNLLFWTEKYILGRGRGNGGGVGLGERKGLGRWRKRAGKIEGQGCPRVIFEQTLKKEQSGPSTYLTQHPLPIGR